MSVAAIALASCGGPSDKLSPSEQRQLPLTVGDLNELCTKLPSEWHSAGYQRRRRARLRQADALIRALREHPGAAVDARVIDSDSGSLVHRAWTVKRLAREQLRSYDAARYCTRPGTPTSRSAATAALRRIDAIRDLLAAK